MGFDIAADGTVYVADHYNHRVQYFTSSGQFLGKWGGQGTGDGQFSGYLNVAAGKNGVYVSDVGDDTSTIHVQHFSRTGEFRSNTLPMRRSMTEKVGNILAGMDDTLYANFLLPGEIRHYTPDGTLLSRWGRFIEENIIAGGADVSVAGDGSIVLVDGARLMTLGPLGEVKANVDLNGILPPTVHERYFLRAVETASDGSRYVVAREVEWLPGDEGRVQVSHSMVQLGPSNVVEQTWLLSQGTYVFSHIPPGPEIAISPDDAIYVLDRAKRIVRRYSDDGHVLHQWSLPEVADRIFSETSEIDIAADRTVFVVRYWWDNDENVTPPPPRVERYAPNGELVDEWLFDQQEVRVQGPSSRSSYALAVGASGVVYLGAKYGWDSAELKAYTADGQLLATWGRTGFGPYREVDRPAFLPIAIDTTRDEGLVVVDDMPGLQSAFVRVFSAVSRDWWRINYFSDKDMTGWPIASQRITPDVDRFYQDWEVAAPPANVPAEGFAARIDGAITVTGGQYCFDMESMGGIKVWVDDNLMIDRWNEVETTEEQCMILSSGTHRMFVDYLDSGWEAKVSVDWVTRATGSSLYLPRAGLSR